MICAALLLLSSTKNGEKNRVFSNFKTTVSYVVCVILAQHRVLYWERGLDENHLLYE